MSPFRMRFLICSLIVLSACASDYRGLTAMTPDKNCVEKIRPKVIGNSWFDASIDVVGKHISGLILTKHMEDSSSRVVFTNEAGVKFLDFEYSVNGEFKVHHILEQLDKKAVIKLLENDFKLILGLPFRNAPVNSFRMNNEVYNMVTDGKKSHYFVTDQNCTEMIRIESGSSRKRVVTLNLFGNPSQPDSLHLQHHTFAMKMTLKKLNSH
jgi:hypothetical protein